MMLLKSIMLYVINVAMITMDTSYNSTHAVITRVLINVHNMDIAHAYKCMCQILHSSSLNFKHCNHLGCNDRAVSRWIPSGWVWLINWSISI